MSHACPVVAMLAVVSAIAACAPHDDGAPDAPPANAAVAPAVAAAPTAPPAEPPPAALPFNIVVITIDTLRADHLGCYGYARNTTPCIDKLAARGVLFTQAATQWPKTGPSMSAFITSTYGSTSGVARSTMDQKVPLAYDALPEVLQKAGYQTLGVVSNMSLAPTFQFDQGFEKYELESGRPADKISETARGLVAKRDPKRPFFLWVHYLDPHAPYKPPPGHGEEYPEFIDDDMFQKDDRPPVKVDPRLEDPASAKVDGNEVGMIPSYAYLPGKERIRDYVAQYDGDIRFLDQGVGMLTDWLEKSGNLAHTILVVTADHGESLGDHNYFFEHGRFPYDDCVHVPLILLHPDLKPAKVAGAVGLIDLAPTLVEMVGVAPGWQFEGHSLVSWLQAGAPDGDSRVVFTESGYLKQFEVSVRKGRWKLIKVGTNYVAKMLTGRPYELYDLVDDPGETTNLIDDKPDVVDELQPLLDQYVSAAYARKPPADATAATLGPDEKKAIDELGYGNDKARGEQGDEAEKKKDGGGGK